nr:unnamed protein product [Callosobruchus analis]
MVTVPRSFICTQLSEIKNFGTLRPPSSPHCSATLHRDCRHANRQRKPPSLSCSSAVGPSFLQSVAVVGRGVFVIVVRCYQTHVFIVISVTELLLPVLTTESVKCHHTHRCHISSTRIRYVVMVLLHKLSYIDCCGDDIITFCCNNLYK